MGSYQNIVKTEEIRKKAEEGDLLAAQNILDTVDLKKIKNMSDLNLFAEVFMRNEKYEEAAKLYLKIYERYKTRKATAQMVTISMKMGNIQDAEEYLEEYQQIAPEDFENYIFRYKLDKMKGASYEQLIQSLKELKRLDYSEKWAYELAKVYYKADMEKECIRECSDMVLWFGEGTYVEKAKVLRSYFIGDTDKYRIMEALKKKPGGQKEELAARDFGEDAKEEPDEDEDDGNVLPEEATQQFDAAVIKESGELSPFEGFPEEVQDISSEEGLEAEDTTKLEEQYSEEEPQEQPEAVSEPLPALKEEDALKQLEGILQFAPADVFGNFLQNETVKQQLVNCLMPIAQGKIKTVFMLIAGSEESGKAFLAKDVALFLSKAGRLKSTRIAKISADKLNRVDIQAKRDILKGSCLVIDHASSLKKVTINKLLELAKSLEGNIAVILEEEEEKTGQLLEIHPKLKDLLRLQIHLS